VYPDGAAAGVGMVLERGSDNDLRKDVDGDSKRRTGYLTYLKMRGL